MKRFLDVTVAFVVLLVACPLFLVIACAIWIDDRGPILYRAQRVGRGGVLFPVLKFRTMTTHQVIRSEMTIRNDPRITRVGRILRATKLDELPQLVNVLRGEMSLVGPRPLPACYVETYTPEQLGVLAVRPGITGAAQVRFRNEEQMISGDNFENYYLSVLLPAKLAIDLEYVHHWSLWLDFKLLWQTFLVLFWPFALSQKPEQSALALAQASEATGGEPAKIASKVPFGATMKAWITYHLVRRVVSYGGAVISDVVIVVAAYEMATLLRFADMQSLEAELRLFFWPDLAIGGIYAAVSYLIGLHRTIWRYASIKDGVMLFQAVGITMMLVSGLEIAGAAQPHMLPLSVNIVGGFLAFLFLGCVKVFPRVRRLWRKARARGSTTRVLLVGAGEAGARLAALLIKDSQEYKVVAFVDDDQTKWQRRIHHIPIVGAVADIPQVVKKYSIDLIALAMPSVGAERIGEVISLAQQTTASIKILPSLQEMLDEQPQAISLREVNVADLLGREVVPLQSPEAQRLMAGKTILVTGAAGSIGSELCRQLITYKPARVIALDNNETGLFDLAESLRTHPDAARLLLRINDITQVNSMARLFEEERPHLVFHAAAYKHIPLLEDHPDQAIRTNVLGTYSLCRLARDYQVNCFVFVSSDKAVDPVNVLGASKYLGEQIIQTMARTGSATRFCAVRFGNVIGSRGSVVPTFIKQIEQGGPVTVTDPAATRYFMTIPEACGLVILTATLAGSGGTFLLDMGEPVRIADLAVKMIRSRGLRVGRDIPIVYTGLRPGERLHELLVAPGEKLQPTTQSKIFRVVQEQPRVAALADQWINTMEGWLEREDSAALRVRLLDKAREKVLV